MRIVYAFILAVTLFVPSAVFAKTDVVLQKDLALKYIVREPAAKSATAPLIILLHGYGSNEGDLFSLVPQLPQDAIVLSARAPQTLDHGYAWFAITVPGAASTDIAGQARARELLLQFIEQAGKKYHVPASRIYLMGFSQGAIMSYTIALTQPEKIRGIAVLSGRLLDDIKPRIAKAENVNKVSIFIGHGTEDKIIPIEKARDAHNYLTGKKINTDYREYKIVHTISPEEMSDVQKWLAGCLENNRSKQ